MSDKIIYGDENKFSDLIFLIEKNDSISFRLLYDASNKKLLFYAYGIVKNMQIAEEIVQETFTSIWLHADSYNRNMGSPVTWMRRIVRNKALDALRASSFYLRNVNFEEADEKIVSNDFVEPDAILSEKQSSIVLMKYLRGLSGAQMEVIYLSYYDGLSHAEVASMLSEPLGTVKNRIRLGILRLKRKQSGLQKAFALNRHL